MAEPKVVKFCTQVGYINSSNRMTYHQQKGRGYGHVIVVCRHAARRAGLSATAEVGLLVTFDVAFHFFIAGNSINTSNLLCGLNMASPSPRTTDCP